jgi:bifunctional UDP-N-acetylglucosamine pyrophosphorylase/glucosamine-1-phosphate N-acetyltransferase
VSDQVTAIVLAAGMGTRMKSALPKVLHEVAGSPMITHALRSVLDAGADQVVAVVGHERERVEAVVHGVDASITVAVQEEQHGTGHAVRCGLEALVAERGELLGGTVVVTYGDVPLLTADTIADLVREHTDNQHAITIVTARLADPTGYGRIVRDDSGAVREIREHRDADAAILAIDEINSGVLAVDATFLARVLETLEPSNSQGEYYLTDIVGAAVAQDLPVGAHLLEDVWQTEGVNDRRQLARLGAELNRRIGDKWMLAGVTIVDPASTWIDTAVELASDVTILPGTHLLGATVVAAGATIGPDTTLRNVEVGAGATVVRTHGSDALIGAGASVGPFAYLRPGTELGTDAKVGTFVETKNTKVGDGAKIPHLSYLGDATVGAGANVGAGAITANYDGQHKHPTAIGRQAKIGCDNVFVAPVTIGDGAYTGAGSIVRDDIPAGALAVSAGEQRNMEGWVAAKRPGTPADDAAKETTGADD